MNKEQKENIVRLLQSADRAIADVLSELDVREDVCECCNRKRFVTWDEAQAHEQLTAAEVKIRKWLDRFRR